MKKNTSLFQRFIAPENFHLAFERLRRKNTKGGVDNISVARFAENLDANIHDLRQSILDGSYIPAPVESVYIPKFNTAGEWRELGLPTVRDKLAQTALLLAVERKAEAMFLNNSYGYRPGKGAVRALRRVEHILRNEKKTWAASHDIDDFFGTLDHQRLLELWAQLVDDDSRLIELAELWCKMGVIKRDGNWQDVFSGVRQGQVMAPLFANLYLHEFDHFIATNNWGYVRYADDFLLLAATKEEVAEAESGARKYLEKIGLSLNNQQSCLSALEQGFSFLGITFQGNQRNIAAKKRRKMLAHIHWLLHPKKHEEIAVLCERLTAALDGWLRYYSFVEPAATFTLINEKIETDLATLLSQYTKDDTKKIYYPLLPVVFPQKTAALQKCSLAKLLRKRRGNTGNHRLSKDKKTTEKIRYQKRKYQKKEILGSELFVNTPGTFVGKRGERIIVRQKQKIIAEIPVIRLQRVVIAGRGIALSSDIVTLCAEKNIPLSFLDNLGKTCAMSEAPQGAAVETVLLQLQHRESEKGRHLACMFVWAKLKNQLALLKSRMKYKGHKGSTFGQAFINRRPSMEQLIKQVRQMDTAKAQKKDYRKTLMGLEGRFAASYWHLLGLLLQTSGIEFNGRIKRGASDITNVMLNYGYGILYNHVLQALHKNRLNAAAGFLHVSAENKASLSCDLIEEFRASVVDRAVLSLLQRRQKMVVDDEGLLQIESRKKLAAAVLERLSQHVTDKGNMYSLQHLIHIQAETICKYLHDKLVYRPYLARW